MQSQKLSQEKEELLFKLIHRRDSCSSFHLPSVIATEMSPSWPHSYPWLLYPALTALGAFFECQLMACSDLAVLIQAHYIYYFNWRDTFLYSFRFFMMTGSYASQILDATQCSSHFSFFTISFFSPGNHSRTGSVFISKISCYLGARSTCSITLWDLFRCTCTFKSVDLFVREMMGNFIHYQYAWFSTPCTPHMQLTIIVSGQKCWFTQPLHMAGTF